MRDNTPQSASSDEAKDSLKDIFRCMKERDDLQITDEEAEKFQKAFNELKFRELFADYVSEISNPTDRAEHEEYLRILESQNALPAGKATIRPSPGFVLEFKTAQTVVDPLEERKTSGRCNLSECFKCFVNIVYSDKVALPTSQPVLSSPDFASRTALSIPSPNTGRDWSIPYFSGPLRMEHDTSNNEKTLVPAFDCCFNPQSLVYASKNATFRNLIAAIAWKSACSMLNQRADDYQGRQRVTISKEYHILKGVQYKNGSPLVMLCTSNSLCTDDDTMTRQGDAPVKKQTERLFLPNEMESTPASLSIQPPRHVSAFISPSSSCDGWKKGFFDTVSSKAEKGGLLTRAETTFREKRHEENTVHPTIIPSYSITEQTYFEITTDNGCMQGKESVVSATRPTHLAIKIDVPGVVKAEDLDLDVSEEMLVLESKTALDEGTCYKLVVKLPYSVHSDAGTAKFDTARCRLTVLVPIVKKLNNLAHHQSKDE